MLTRVQALVRAFLQRKKYRIQRISIDKKAKYFKVEESRETLTSEPFNPN